MGNIYRAFFAFGEPMISAFTFFSRRNSKPVMIHLDDEVVRELDEHRTRDYPYKSRGAVIRNALDEYLRRANKSPMPATAATVTAKATAITAPAPQDWR